MSCLALKLCNVTLFIIFDDSYSFNNPQTPAQTGGLQYRTVGAHQLQGGLQQLYIFSRTYKSSLFLVCWVPMSQILVMTLQRCRTNR